MLLRMPFEDYGLTQHPLPLKLSDHFIQHPSLPLRRFFAVTVAALCLAPSAKAESKTTLENMQAAYNGESNAHARYLAFAKPADQEGYGEVASLFRAAARAEEIHPGNHAVVIKKR
jgi:hypothetical protein